MKLIDSGRQLSMCPALSYATAAILVARNLWYSNRVLFDFTVRLVSIISAIFGIALLLPRIATSAILPPSETP